MTPDEMFERLISPDFQGDGRLANDFLSVVQRGYRLSSVGQLLRSENVHSRGVGAFIATFLRRDAVAAFEPVIAELLDDPVWRIRMDAIEALTCCATMGDGRVLGKILLMLDSDDDGDRHAVTVFVRVVDDDILRLAIVSAVSLKPDSPFSAIETSHRRREYRTRAGIARSLRSDCRVVRRFAAAMAGRPFLVINENLLELVENSGDHDVSVMVANVRKLPIPMGSVLSSKL